MTMNTQQDMNEALQDALSWAISLLNEMEDNTTWYFWRQTYVSVLGDWLTQDEPVLAFFLDENNLFGDFFSGVAEHVAIMRIAEGICDYLPSEPRNEILEAPTVAADDSRVLRYIADELGDSSDSNVTIAQHVIRIARKRGATEWSFSSALRESDSYKTDESSVVVTRLRDDSDLSNNTCVLIDTSSLPAALRGRTTERQCLAVRVPHQWHEAIEGVPGARGLRFCAVQPTPQTFGMQEVILLNNNIVVGYHRLFEQLFRFRRQMPVLYVCESDCVLVVSSFNHFSQLPQLGGCREQWLADCEAEDNALDDVGEKLPDGTRLVPLVIETVTDWTADGPNCMKWCVEEFRGAQEVDDTDSQDVSDVFVSHAAGDVDVKTVGDVIYGISWASTHTVDRSESEDFDEMNDPIPY
jgi:hypothetical protein